MAGEKIVVVDDEESVKLLLERVLTKAGFSVLAAGTGEQAIDLLTKEPAQLLIVDKSLPRMSGFEVITRARQLQPNIAVVMITAHPEPFTAAQERLDGYLAKPFKTIGIIIETAKNALELRAAAQARADMKAKLEKVVAELTPSLRRS